jgi:hypothetical protein
VDANVGPLTVRRMMVAGNSNPGVKETSTIRSNSGTIQFRGRPPNSGIRWTSGTLGRGRYSAKTVFLSPSPDPRRVQAEKQAPPFPET